jgi:hypothetical protein
VIRLAKRRPFVDATSTVSGRSNAEKSLNPIPALWHLPRWSEHLILRRNDYPTVTGQRSTVLLF